VEDLKIELEAIRNMARSRIQVLNEEADFYNEAQKAYYLQKYESKLRELDQLIDALTPEPVSKPHGDKRGSASCIHKLR